MYNDPDILCKLESKRLKTMCLVPRSSSPMKSDEHVIEYYTH